MSNPNSTAHSQQLSVVVDRRRMAELDAIARQRSTTRAAVIRDAIERELDREEERHARSAP
jgi:predicted transcriptional regulator